MDCSVFKVFVLHEDLVSGIRATGVLGRLSANLEADPDPETELWEFNALRLDELWKQAITHAIEADMIIISTATEAPLPDHVAEWLDSALFLKRGGQPSVVVLLEWQAEPGAESSRRCASVRGLAEKHGVDFLTNAGDWKLDPAGAANRARELEHAV